jgi:hypothetical protein
VTLDEAKELIPDLRESIESRWQMLFADGLGSDEELERELLAFDTLMYALSVAER